MGNTKNLFLLSATAVLLVASAAQPAFGQKTSQPNATFLLGGELFADGQSNNLGPTANQILGDYWVEGGCPDDEGSYRHCDDLRFGMTMYADPSCTLDDADSGGCTEYNNVMVVPHEDGGDDVEDEIKQVHNKGGQEFNDDGTFRPLDDALDEHQRATFEGTEANSDSPWDRPNLNLLVLQDLPQSHDQTTTDNGYDERVKRSILTACRMLEGDDGVNGPGTWPASPTWAMVGRRYEERAVPFTGLVSAAGGTASCCYDPNPYDDSSCDPVADAIDVCDWVDPRDEESLRGEIEDGHYVCGPGKGYVQTGPMTFNGSGGGSKPEIACHMAGRYNSGSGDCEGSGFRGTDVFGIMSCVRQLEDDIDPDLATFYYCEGGGDEDDGDETCTELTICDDDIDNDGELNDDDPCPYDDDHDDPSTCPTDKSADECTGVEWVAPNRSLYVITAEDEAGDLVCDKVNDNDGDIAVAQCPNEGDFCTTDERLDGSPAYGRCSVGTIYCDHNSTEHCQQLYNPMPEICNGLDDDCDGNIDNLSTSWDDPNFSAFDPTELSSYDSDGVDREAIHCYEKNVCRCRNSTLDYGGPGYEAHIMSWVPDNCECGEGLEQASGGYTPAPAIDDQPRAGCSSTGGGGTSGVAWLFAIGVAGWLRRRK